MTHVICWLTAKDRDQLRNPTLGNQVWATFTFLQGGPGKNGTYNLRKRLQQHLFLMMQIRRKFEFFIFNFFCYNNMCSAIDISS